MICERCLIFDRVWRDSLSDLDRTLEGKLLRVDLTCSCFDETYGHTLVAQYQPRENIGREIPIND